VAAWLAAGPRKVQAVEATVYRIRNYYLAVGLTCTACFTAFGVVSTLAALWNSDGSFPHPLGFAVLFGVFWSCFSLLGIWLVLAYFRERLFVSDLGIRQKGCFRTRTLQFAQLITARWRTWPQNGSLVLKSPEQRIVVDFDNFQESERIELIEFFRQRLAESSENWIRFEASYLVPRVVPAQARRRHHVAMAGMFLAFGLFFGFTDIFIPGQPRQPALAVANLVAAGGLCFLASKANVSKKRT
jgi:hypothetical protein